MDATPIRDHDELVALVRRRQDELGVACVTIDQVAGLADGHFAKLTCGIKRFGPVSIFLVLSALGLRLRIEEDPAAIAKFAPRWLPRNESYAANAYKRGGLRAALLAPRPGNNRHGQSCSARRTITGGGRVEAVYAISGVVV
jgi:hypothetical protein